MAKLGQQGYHDGKALLDVSVQQVIDLVLSSLAESDSAPGGLSKTLTPPPIVSYIDGRRMPDPYSYAETKATGIVGGKETQIASMWINRMHTGTWIAVSHPDTPIAHESATRFAEHVSKIIKTVAAQGDYSFSAPEGAS